MVDTALNPRHPRLYFQPVCLESVCVMVLGILDIPLWMKWICGYLQLSPQHWQRWGRALNVIQIQIQLLLHSISLFNLFNFTILYPCVISFDFIFRTS